MKKYFKTGVFNIVMGGGGLIRVFLESLQPFVRDCMCVCFFRAMMLVAGSLAIYL